MNEEFDSTKQMKTNLSISVNKEMNENKRFKNIINELRKENDLLKNKVEEQRNSFSEKLNLKEKNIQDLIEENLALKRNQNDKHTKKEHRKS